MEGIGIVRIKTYTGKGIKVSYKLYNTYAKYCLFKIINTALESTLKYIIIL